MTDRAIISELDDMCFLLALIRAAGYIVPGSLPP